MNIPEGFWQAAKDGKCCVCGGATNWIEMDLGYWHPDCDMYPDIDEDGNTVTVVVIHGERVE